MSFTGYYNVNYTNAKLCSTNQFIETVYFNKSAKFLPIIFMHVSFHFFPLIRFINKIYVETK